MKKIITIIDDNGIRTEEGPDANETLQGVRWATKKVAVRERPAAGWMSRAIQSAALNEARRSISEREARRLSWGI